MKKIIKFVLDALFLVFCTTLIPAVSLIPLAVETGNRIVLIIMIMFVVIVAIGTIVSYYRTCKAIKEGDFKIDA